MQRRALALILSLAMLVCLVSATGLLSVSADDTQWTADETGNATYTTIARNTELTTYMAGQGITESALNYHMNPLSVYGENGKTFGRQNSSGNAANGLPRQLCDGDIGSNEGHSWGVTDQSPWSGRRIVYFCEKGKMNYFTYDLQQNSALTDFVVAGSQLDGSSYLLKNIKVYVSDTAYDGTAATLGAEVFSHMGETSEDINDYNYHVRLNTPVIGRYVTFAVGSGDKDELLRLGELAAYGTRLSYDAKGNLVRELRAPQDIPTYDNALKSATGKVISGTGGIPWAGNLLNGIISGLTTDVDYLVTDEETSTYKSGDKLYNADANFLGAAQKAGYTWFTVNEDGSYTVQNIPMSGSEYAEKSTDGSTTVTKYRRYVKATIGWGGNRIAVRADYLNEDRHILGTNNQFYYDLGGVTDVEKVMVASGVNRGEDKYKNGTGETVSDGELNIWNGTLESSGGYIVSGIKLYVANTLEGLIADGTFRETALVADFTQEKSNDMDTAVELTLENVWGQYIGFALTTPANNLRLSELAVKTGEKHGNWHIDTASAADTAGDSLLNTVGVASTNLANSATEVAKLGDGYGTSNNKVDINTSTSNDGKNADGDTMACIPGEGTEIKGTSGWAKVWLELNAEVSIDSFLMMGSLGDSDSGGNFGRKSLCRNRTIAYYRIYVSDSKDDLFTDGKMVVDCNNVGDNVLGSNPASGAYDAFRNYLETPATGRFIGVKLTTGAYGSARVGEFHVYGKAIADVTTWTDCSSSDITVPPDNLLAGVYKNVTAYEQHSLKAGQEDELTKWSTGNAANFDKVFDGKVWAGSSSEDNNNSKWTPIVEDTNTDSTKSANYIWLDFDLGLQYNIDAFFHAAADRGASTVDFFVTDKSVAELVKSKAEPNVYMIGETSGPKGIATYKKLHESVKGSHVIVRLKGNLNAGIYQMWVSELAVSGEMASPLYYKGASKRLEDNGLRFGFNVAVKDAAYLNGDPKDNGGDYRRDIDSATIVVNGESRKVKAFGAIVTNLKEGWASYLTDVTAAEKDTKHVQVVEANNLYAVQTGYVTYTALVKGIPEAYKDRVIHARSYVAYEDANGNLQYIYGEIVSSSVAAIG